MSDYICYVCRQEIRFSEDVPHTYHAEGCPSRDLLEAALQHGCDNLSGCGEDVHEECCPTCTAQAF